MTKAPNKQGLRGGKTAARALGWSLAASLMLAVWWQFRPTIAVEAHPRTSSLAELLPGAVPGWETADEAVADTEEMKRAVVEMLNYDEAILRTYRQKDRTVSVYIAYWRPAKFHPRLVAQHTPDVCWTGAGWRMSDVAQLIVPLGFGGQTVPGESRVFEQGGQRLKVVYWHLVGGRVYHAANAQGVTFLRYLLDDLRRGQREQYFIRVSHNLTAEQVSSEPLFSKIWQALGPLGLKDAKSL
jgi:EpsI family protein